MQRDEALARLRSMARNIGYLSKLEDTQAAQWALDEIERLETRQEADIKATRNTFERLLERIAAKDASLDEVTSQVLRTADLEINRLYSIHEIAKEGRAK